MSYGRRPDKEKEAARGVHQAMFRALIGESMIVSPVVGQDPVTVVQQMIEGVDLDEHEAWAEEAEARLDSLEGTQAGDRLYFLCVPLRNSGIHALTAPLTVAAGNVKASLALPHHGVSQGEVDYRMAQAARIESLIPRTFSPRRVTVAQQVWLEYHLQFRGLDSTGFSREDLESVAPVRHIGDPVIDEGGKSDEGPRLSKLNPFAHRYAKVGDEDSFAEGLASYQSMFALTGLPQGGLQFPGSEILGNIDSYIPGADFVLRLRGRSSDAAKRANKLGMHRINEQLDQRATEVGTGHHDLDASLDALTEYDQVLSNDRNEVEEQPVILFAVCSDSAEDVVERATLAVKTLRDEDMTVVHPAGYQEDLWWAFTPGAPLTAKVNEFAQITTSRDLSGLVPITVAKLGDTTGALIAENQTSALLSHVLLDLPNTSGKRDMSGCIGVTGELGSGKSTTMKILMKALVDRDGCKIIATDRSETSEWVKFISTLTRPTIVDMTEPAYSLDPLRILDAGKGSELLSNFLVLLLDLDPTSEEGVLLGEVIAHEYVTEHHITGLGALLEHLTALAKEGNAEAKTLAGKMRVYATKDLGRVLFDDSLPPLPWRESQSIVIRTNRLEMPENTELEHNHLYKIMRIQKRFGRAAYTLITTLARVMCFDNPDEFAAYFEDESHMATSNELQIVDLKTFIRDGRKHGAALILGSHDPEHDFGDETMRSLIPIRIVHKQTDKELAKRSLRWIGLDAEDEDLVDELRTDISPQVGDEVPPERRGEAFMRDASGTIGRVRFLTPASTASREAITTTPGQHPEVSAHD
ncbi:ATP-binding protein [Brachybacterium kimchii]|uniref:ATP-binding protein n=1 Tax=Brachybacterium kimchii TaxID=2942909 RepID=A0ABY4NCB4_9MICO|nr:ATP-binding protein [Brachybacterium kimchii]UQN31809.1 ATP-binding protein [Brachybacterium kimchii]